jgi:LysR family transcriptional regulator, low CO2-responsive transcriptional regulator
MSSAGSVAPGSRHMRYSQLRAFHAVAHHGSFSRAALELRVTQPAVTLQVKALETDYSVLLFRRGARRTVLTDAGRSLLQLTTRMFDVEDEIRQLLGAAQALKGGTVRLAADEPHVALRLVERFRKRHPQVSVALSVGNTASVWKVLHDAEADAVIISEAKGDASVRMVSLAQQGLVALLPAQHRWARRSTLRVEELRDQPLVMRERGSNTRRTLERALSRSGVTPTSMLEIGSREAVREAVALGLGIGFVFDREATDDPRTIAVPISGLESCTATSFAFRRGDSKRAVVQTLRQIAEELASGK